MAAELSDISKKTQSDANTQDSCHKELEEDYRIGFGLSKYANDNPYFLLPPLRWTIMEYACKMASFAKEAWKWIDKYIPLVQLQNPAASTNLVGLIYATRVIPEPIETVLAALDAYPKQHDGARKESGISRRRDKPEGTFFYEYYVRKWEGFIDDESMQCREDTHCFWVNASRETGHTLIQHGENKPDQNHTLVLYLYDNQIRASLSENTNTELQSELDAYKPKCQG